MGVKNVSDGRTNERTDGQGISRSRMSSSHKLCGIVAAKGTLSPTLCNVMLLERFHLVFARYLAIHTAFLLCSFQILQDNRKALISPDVNLQRVFFQEVPHERLINCAQGRGVHGASTLLLNRHEELAKPGGKLVVRDIVQLVMLLLQQGGDRLHSLIVSVASILRTALGVFRLH